MLYMISGTDVPGTLEKRLAARPAHLRRIQDLQDQGRLILAGPHPVIDSPDPGDAGFSGSLIVAEFDSITAAEEWAQSDPYVEAGVFSSVVVKPFNKVLP